MVNLFPLAKPFIHLLDPEVAHKATIAALRLGLGPLAASKSSTDPSNLSVEAFGLKFPNPVGLAAGFDKNAQVPDAILALGFGFTEAGTVTPRPQAGNARPRLFRLSEDRGVINRMGFNNDGLAAFKIRVRTRDRRRGLVGANLGANKDSHDRIEDYVTGLRSLSGLVDYFTINISSPNTPGLRGLQNKGELEELIRRLLEARLELQDQTPILLKIAPDVSDEELEDIIDVICTAGIDGLILGNTSIGLRDTLKSRYAKESGGLSGTPLFNLSTERLGLAYRLIKNRMPIIGVGGISSGRDAYEKILSGATLVQLYSALVFDGPGLVADINRDLDDYLKTDGFASVSEAVGAKWK